MLQFEKKECERLEFVCVNGKNKVSWHCTGVESFVHGAILFNHLKLTDKGVVRVFGEDKTYRGYIKRSEYGIPKRYQPEPEDLGTNFDDWFQYNK